MNNIDKLCDLMKLDADVDTPDIEKRFEQIAQMLFENLAIQKGETIYLFKEIEFYFYNKNHCDIITHPRVSKPLCWYVNDFGGIDLNFASCIVSNIKPYGKGCMTKKYMLDDRAYYGGILIRQLIEKDSGDVLSGPWACAELFRCFDAAAKENQMPILIEHDNGTSDYIREKRINILRTDQDAEKKVDNILYAYSEYPEKTKLYKAFVDFKEKAYRYLR